jgi:hypothetical protein
MDAALAFVENMAIAAYATSNMSDAQAPLLISMPTACTLHRYLHLHLHLHSHLHLRLDKQTRRGMGGGGRARGRPES